MRAGELRHRVIIQVPQRAPNSISELVDTWADWQTVWAAVEPLSGNRLVAAKQINAEVTGVCRIRYHAGVKPFMRLSFEGRTLKILSILQPKEIKDEIDIYYKEQLD